MFKYLNKYQISVHPIEWRFLDLDLLINNVFNYFIYKSDYKSNYLRVENATVTKLIRENTTFLSFLG